MRINKTPPYIPFEKKKPIQCKFVDCGFFDKKGNYKEDWQLVRINEIKKRVNQ